MRYNLSISVTIEARDLELKKRYIAISQAYPMSLNGYELYLSNGDEGRRSFWPE